jgi:hypothetical protein
VPEARALSRAEKGVARVSSQATDPAADYTRRRGTDKARFSFRLGITLLNSYPRTYFARRNTLAGRKTLRESVPEIVVLMVS